MAGRRIDDHSSWIGKGSGGVVFPMSAKMMGESEANAFGGLGHYEDTTEAIKAQQNLNVKKVHGHPHKAGTRT